MTVFLMDNGSLQPDAVFSLRRVSAELSRHLGQRVEPVSVLHSNRIAAGDLGGGQAAVFRSEVLKLLERGERELRILPFFLGPSNALLEYIPLTVGECYPSARLNIRVAWPICRDREDAGHLATAVIRQAGEMNRGEEMILVDHGTPRYEVHQVREWVRDAVAGRGTPVRSCSMESREGAQYAFNQPLLDNLLRERAKDPEVKAFVIALLFLLRGRHASYGGDVDQICSEALRDAHAPYRLSGVLGETPEVLSILTERWQQLNRGDYWFSVT